MIACLPASREPPSEVRLRPRRLLSTCHRELPREPVDERLEAADAQEPLGRDEAVGERGRRCSRRRRACRREKTPATCSRAARRSPRGRARGRRRRCCGGRARASGEARASRTPSRRAEWRSMCRLVAPLRDARVSTVRRHAVSSRRGGDGSCQRATAAVHPARPDPLECARVPARAPRRYARGHDSHGRHDRRDRGASTGAGGRTA